jgi:hypothetical protein
MQGRDLMAQGMTLMKREATFAVGLPAGRSYLSQGIRLEVLRNLWGPS